MQFKDWFDNVDYAVWEELKDTSVNLDKLFELQMITQNKNVLVNDPGANHLVPYGNIERSGDTPISAYMRDAPEIRAYALANPENLASTLIFVLLTIRASFVQVTHDFPIVMLFLFHHFRRKNEKEKFNSNELKDVVKRAEIKVAQVSNPALHDKDGFLAGFSLGTTIFNTKFESVTQVWQNRNSLYSKIKSFADRNDAVGLFYYIAENVHGLKAAKAGFCVQIILGMLGCIDMHNLNLYSAYAKKIGNKSLYKKLSPELIYGKSKKSYENYIKVLDKLEADGADTIKLWDIWVNYVGHIYSKSYDSNAPSSANTVDPQDPLIQKLMDLDLIKDRNTEKDSSWNFGISKAGGTASRAHRLIANFRNLEYWKDILRSAEHPSSPPDEVRVEPAGEKLRAHKALAYLVAMPELARTIGLSDEYLARAKAALEKKGILFGPHYEAPKGKGNYQSPLGKSHFPKRTVSKHIPINTKSLQGVE